MAQLLIIDNYDSFTWNLVQIVEQGGCKDYIVVKNDKIHIKEVENFGSILISPGPGIPSESGNICEIIKRYSASKSILGICLGHQAIAEVFGGKLYNIGSVRHGIKMRVNITIEDNIFSGIEKTFEAGLYHSWAVSYKQLPEDLEVTAISEEGIIMGIRHKIYDVKGLQFHPESIMTKVGKTIIENWLNETNLK